MRTSMFSRAALVLGLVLLFTGPLAAQTATTATTVSGAVDGTQQTITLASATGLEVNGAIFVDREYMSVSGVNGTTATVTRGAGGTAATPHLTGAIAYVATNAQIAGVFVSRDRSGTCVRANERFLPQINAGAGNVWNCPVGTTQAWVLVNPRGTQTTRTVWFNIDNGASITIDDVILNIGRPVRVTSCRIIYVDATTGTVAQASASVGTTVGGTDVVAATGYENTKAVGTTTAMTVLASGIAANGSLFVRHHGIAATQAGQTVVECEYSLQ